MKTLIIRLSSLGDVLLASTVVRGIAAADPTGTIDFCTRPQYAELIAHHPHIRRVIPYDDQEAETTYAALRTEEIYDCVVDLHNNFRSRRLCRGLETKTLIVRKRSFARWLLVHTKINLLKHAPDVISRYMATVAPLGIEDDGEGPEFFPANDALPESLTTFCAERPTVGICPGAKHFTKRWPAERYAELCHTLIASGKHVLLLGGEFDNDICRDILSRLTARTPTVHAIQNVCGQLTLSQIARAMDLCESIVTNDSGLMHLAAARHRPIIAIFGSTVREFGFAPRKRSVIIEVEPLSCRPCSHIGRSSCPKGHFKCMLSIDVRAVNDAVLNAT